jgi:hypothetical protein
MHIAEGVADIQRTHAAMKMPGRTS